jgi:membrane protein implicated in regulation of membrane protease activity
MDDDGFDPMAFFWLCFGVALVVVAFLGGMALMLWADA